MYKKYKPLFSLDPNVTYLNHGSFGACPKIIFDSLIKFQKQLEFEPVNFLFSDLFQYLKVYIQLVKAHLSVVFRNFQTHIPFHN